MELTSQLIPAWLVSIIMLHTAIVWIVSRKAKVRMDSRIIAYTLIFQAVVYGVAFQFFNLPTETRGFFSRLMIIVLCLSQSLPLTISYIRSLKHGTR